MTEFQKYIQRYLDLVSPELNSELQNNLYETQKAFESLIPNENFAYAEGKWSLKTLLQHIIDTEKIFSYRALCIARGDTQSLPGFDENLYAENSQNIHTNLEMLLKEFKLIRETNLLFFGNLDETHLQKTGLCNQNRINVQTLGQLMVGHCRHHLTILNQRYLPVMPSAKRPY